MYYCFHLCELNCSMLALMDNEVTLFLLKSFFISFMENCLIETTVMKVIRVWGFFNNFLLLSQNQFFTSVV